MEREDDPQLWDLLKHSKVPAPSPFFARNVLRAVRNDSFSTDTAPSWFSLRRLLPIFSALAAVVIAAFTLNTFNSNRSTRTGGDQIASVTDTELATDLDVLSGDEDNDDAPLL